MFWVRHCGNWNFAEQDNVEGAEWFHKSSTVTSTHFVQWFHKSSTVSTVASTHVRSVEHLGRIGEGCGTFVEPKLICETGSTMDFHKGAI